MSEGTFWGAPRTARSKAIAVVNRLSAHRDSFRTDKYDVAEHAILEELDALDLPADMAAVVQVQCLAKASADKEAT